MYLHIGMAGLQWAKRCVPRRTLSSALELVTSSLSSPSSARPLRLPSEAASLVLFTLRVFACGSGASWGRAGSSLGKGREESTVLLQGHLLRRDDVPDPSGTGLRCDNFTAQGSRLCEAQQFRKRGCCARPDRKVVKGSML